MAMYTSGTDGGRGFAVANHAVKGPKEIDLGLIIIFTVMIVIS